MILFEHEIVAWHNDYDERYSIEDTGFDYQIDDEFLEESASKEKKDWTQIKTLPTDDFPPNNI